MENVIRAIFRTVACVFLLMTFLILWGILFNYKISWIPWVNFLLELPKGDLAMIVFVSWIFAGLIAWEFPHYFE
jgi:polyferredoxin